MKKRFFYWVLMAALTLLLAGPQAMAKDKDKKGASETPPGWEKGAKKGWESDVPPRHDKEAKEAISKETAVVEETVEDAGKQTEKAKKELKKAEKKAKEAKELSE
ncbi:MAG: hypothetical protein JRG75_03060 [Deltaproteobacteria bacterium]|nr:hypothetical protein [Deltaproteobacteria bacterium]